jgi:hypothetical protein
MCPYIRDVLILNRAWGSGYPDWDFYGFHILPEKGQDSSFFRP